MWDDHEIANNAWRDGAENHNPDRGEGDWAARKAAAVQAYFEWMPIRDTSARLIHRSFRFGGLLDLFMLDTRLEGRNRQVMSPEDFEALADPRRSLLGRAQEEWLFSRLAASQRAGTTWRVVGQQLLFGQLAPAGRRVRSTDPWDGYQASRARVFDPVRRARIDNLVIASGDIHSAWALDLAPNPWDGRMYDPATGRGSVAVEFVAPAVSSPPAFASPAGRERMKTILGTCPHVRFLDGERNGYLILDITTARVQADWYFVDTVAERTARELHGRRLVTESGSGRLG